MLAWATRDLVLADKLSGDAWAVMLTLAGSVLGVVVATASPTVREIARFNPRPPLLAGDAG